MNKPRCGNRDARLNQGDEFGIDVNLNIKSKLKRRKREDSPGKDYI